MVVRQDRQSLGIFEKVLGVVALVVGLVAAWRVTGPTIRPDEWGYLLNGQVLLGRTEPLLPFARYYGPIYGFVTAAGSLVTGSLSGAFRFSLMFNIAVIVGVGVVTTRLARRWGAAPRVAALCGLLVAVAPGGMTGAVFAWAEPLVRLLVVVLANVAYTFELDKDRRSLVAFVFLSGLAPSLHGRLVLVVGCSLILLVLWWRQNWLHTKLFIASVASLMFLYASGRAFAFVLRPWLYRNRMTQESRLLGLVRDPSHLTDFLREAAGQGWYLLASTVGLAFVGFVACMVRSRGILRQNAQPGDGVALYTVLFTVSMLLVGSLQLVEASRGDQFIYGRYVETVAPLLLVAGIHVLFTQNKLIPHSWTVSTLAVAFVPVGMTIVLRQDIVAQWVRLNGPLRSPNVPALDGMQSLIGGAGLVRFAIAFALLCVVCIVVFLRFRFALLPVLAVVFLSSSTWTMFRTMDVRAENWRGLGSTFVFIERSRSTVVGYDDSTPSDKRYYILRYHLHPVQLTWMPVSSPGAIVPDSVLCVYGFSDRAPTTGEWMVIGSESTIDRVLWRRASASHC